MIAGAVDTDPPAPLRALNVPAGVPVIDHRSCRLSFLP